MTERRWAISTRWQACLTDLDGTLVASQEVQTRVWSAWGQRRGVDVRCLLAAHGMTHIEKIRQYAPHLNAPVEAALVEAMELADTDGIRALPGAAQLLGSDWLVAIVTSATRRLAHVRLAAAGLEPPKIMVCAEDVTHGKPHPEPYRRAADLLGVLPCRCIAFEDAPAGVTAAVAAGAHVVAVTGTVDALRLADAHEVFADLAAYLASRRASPRCMSGALTAAAGDGYGARASRAVRRVSVNSCAPIERARRGRER